MAFTADTLQAHSARHVRFVFLNCRNKREACRVLDIAYHTLARYLRLADALERATDAPTQEVA